jgi:hypothetical protein
VSLNSIAYLVLGAGLGLFLLLSALDVLPTTDNTPVALIAVTFSILYAFPAACVYVAFILDLKKKG